jgi:hypothetical protein
MVGSKVVEEHNLGFCLGSIASVTGAVEYVVNVFFPCTTVETSLVDTVVLGGTLVQCWCPIVGILCKLESLASGEVLEGGAQIFPINIIKSGIGPVCRDEWVMLLRLVDEVFAHLRRSSGSHNIFILLLGHQFAFMKEGGTSTGDPVGEVAYMPWVSVVYFGADVFGNAVC